MSVWTARIIGPSFFQLVELAMNATLKVALIAIAAVAIAKRLPVVNQLV